MQVQLKKEPDSALKPLILITCPPNITAYDLEHNT
jgi:hypothetical protein